MNYYELVGWKNRSEGKVTKVSAERLNHMDNQILANANAIGNIEEIAGLADGTLCGAVKENKTDIETLTSNLGNIKGCVQLSGIIDTSMSWTIVPYPSGTNREMFTLIGIDVVHNNVQYTILDDRFGCALFEDGVYFRESDGEHTFNGDTFYITLLRTR